MIPKAELEHLYQSSPCPQRFVPSVEPWGCMPGEIAFILRDSVDSEVVLLMGFTLQIKGVYVYDCLMASSDEKYGSLSGIQDWFISSVLAEHQGHKVVLRSFSLFSLFKRASYALSKGLSVSWRCSCEDSDYFRLTDQKSLDALHNIDADALSSVVFLVQK